MEPAALNPGKFLGKETAVSAAAGTGAGGIISVPPGEITDIQVNVNGVFFRNLGRIGSYMDMATSSVPSWITSCTIPPYLNCDGTVFSGGTYPYLVGILGGTTLPDLRGRSRAYLNGGTGRITSASSGIDGNTILSAGGQQAIQLVQAHLPNITFPVSISDTGHRHNLNGGSPVAVGSTSVGSGPSSPGAAGGTISLIDTNTSINVTGISASVVLNGGSVTPFTNMGPTTISGITLIRAG